MPNLGLANPDRSSTEITDSLGQEKIAQDERLRPVATTIHPQPTPLEVDRTSTPGMRDKANMQSAPTGVETSAKSSSVSKDQ